jgi:hypothetical protein
VFTEPLPGNALIKSVTVFTNRVLRRIFGPKRDIVTGGWIKLHNEVKVKSKANPVTGREGP